MGRSAFPTECVSCAESSPSPSSPSTTSPSSSSHPHANPPAEPSSRASNSARKSNRSSRRSGGRTLAKGSKEADREGEVGGESGSGSASAPSKARKLSDASRVADNFQNAERPANPKEEEGEEEAMVTDACPAESSMATEANPARSQGLDAFSAWCRDHAVAFYGEQKPRIDAFTARMLEWRRRAQLLMRRAWPPLRHALVIMGGIAETLALTWLNCTIQGFKSLVQLGSAALFMVICCSALNLGILGGFIKLFISLVLSAAAALFLGYSYALVIFGIFSGVILWLSGSFWLTGGIVFIGGVLFTADQPRLAILVGLLYSTYSTKNIGGWLALFLCLNLAFIFSNLMIYWLHSNGPDTGAQDFTGTTQGYANRADKTQSRRGKQSGAFDPTASYQAESLGAARGATTSEGESSAVEKEVERVLSCKDHYAVLELSRFAEVDLASLKRDYRKKAMLVHPDKNLGNAVAEEAFKRLQNAYEVLLDPSKKRGYDDELKKEEVLLALKRFQQEVLRNGRAGTTENSEDEGDEYSATKRIVCKKCNNSHRWICTDRNKLHARWCQECQDHHQAKDGDGWVEQLGHTFFFGMFQKVEMPRAYACAYSKIYEVTEWVQCQGMKCPPNTHKPSFHVSTAGMFKNQSRGTKANKTAYGNGADNFPFAQMNENMTEEEFIKWLENAMASGMFSDMNEGPGQPDTKAGGHAKASRKKRKGKNKW